MLWGFPIVTSRWLQLSFLDLFSWYSCSLRSPPGSFPLCPRPTCESSRFLEALPWGLFLVSTCGLGQLSGIQQSHHKGLPVITFPGFYVVIVLSAGGKAAFSRTFPCGGGQCEARQAAGPRWPAGPIVLYPLPVRAREAGSGALSRSPVCAAGLSPTATYLFSENSRRISTNVLFLCITKENGPRNK